MLLHRNFAAPTLVTATARTGAHALVRVKNGRRLPVLGRCADDSCIDCEITTATGRRTGLYRLTTTLTDQKRHPAAKLITSGHRRWLRLGRHWPWTTVITTAFDRLQPCRTPTDQQRRTISTSRPHPEQWNWAPTRRDSRAGRNTRATSPISRNGPPGNPTAPHKHRG
ncbi:hypothetical protein [Streptomyces sp. NPDC020951]|uniref:hypothetical protein n=1 Tax=Streptomyces sp. NPDC020951 TaxID=3365104 RepID=UPI0037AB99BF